MRKHRALTITFNKSFDKELEYVIALAEKGINRSIWICQAIKEKIESQKEFEDRLDRLEKEIRKLQQKPAIVTEESDDDELTQAAATFFNLLK